MEAKDYYICRYINKKISKVGIPYDEAAVIVIAFGSMAMMNHFLLGIILAFIAFVAIKRLKKGRGSVYLMYLLYWYTPVAEIRLKKVEAIYFLKKAPAAEKRHWI
ncbi:MAG TPA: type IV conjugative transfer system protein TraL [bacterium]|nr:type IV conjugative transfer system protein TraL [bacterium]